jgi:hypothetical protein
MTRSLSWASFVLAGVLFASCEDSFIDPFANDGKYFTLYGYLDESKNFQPGTLHAVRVVPITRSSPVVDDPDSPNAQIDAEVFSIDVETGQEVRWGHSLVELADGTYGHLFQTRFFIEAGATYRLEVRRSDGIVARAETRVPTTTSIVPDAAEPIVTDGVMRQEVLLPGVRSLWDVEIIYQIGDAICFQGSPARVSYGRVGTSSEAGWRLRVNITDDVRELEQRLGTSDWRVCSIGIRTRIMDSAWTPPGDVFDPETLALPASLSNVDNGYGFFGSLGLLQANWPFSESNSALLGH